ncbi:hypothetical protein M404DRAFT_25631 [Pisolithus tinctorius Marx 270]|uniref:F-box domain-containing protein n=1 Tax=Pisolithus tinctorius Marx 270 TaxID=870435 RepID=A0A0C3PAR7_PISTI|nr:hypothetical protein M404DRAFT_25631 [Pisolithus tinctorius Marx 270]
MHACLLVPDILYLIIGFLKGDGYRSFFISYKDVARLARTCKAFKDPALDALWRTQSSLSPLVMCLPSRFWTRGNRSRSAVGYDRGTSSSPVASLTMQPQPSHEDWLALKRYSRRIQAFDCTALYLPGVCSNTLSAIFQPGLFHELFPSLRGLDFNLFNNREHLYVQPIMLLTPMRLPHLLHLAFTISEHHRRQDPNEILHFPPNCVPSLQTLRIDAACDDANQHITPVRLAVNFGGFPYLRILSLSDNVDVSPSDLRALIHLQDLYELTVALPDDFDIDVHPSIQSILPSLWDLDVTIGSLNRGTSFLSIVSSSRLGHVRISHRLPATQSDIYALFQEIRRIHKRFPYFQGLVVEYSRPTTLATDPSFDLPQSTLRPLLACRYLRVFDLTSWGMLDIDDAFIVQIALAWPYLETFHLRGSQWKISRATLSGLRELLRRCPRLSSLGMEVDARVLPEEEPEMETLTLRSLRIASFGLYSNHPVERYLRILAPSLQTLLIEMPNPPPP